jgi:hypothetical protein
LLKGILINLSFTIAKKLLRGTRLSTDWTRDRIEKRITDDWDFPALYKGCLRDYSTKRPEAASLKLRWELKQMISMVIRYIEINKKGDIIGILGAFRFIRSEFVPEVKKTASSRSKICREIVAY